jgi:hypothetical protein
MQLYCTGKEGAAVEELLRKVLEGQERIKNQLDSIQEKLQGGRR